jgi:hypothetical protein
LGVVISISRNTAALKVLKEKTLYITGMARKYVEFISRYAQQTCKRSLTMGHHHTTCRATYSCRFCGEAYPSTKHQCLRIGCSATTGTACSHSKTYCPVCKATTHQAGDKECRGRTKSPKLSTSPKPTKATTIVIGKSRPASPSPEGKPIVNDNTNPFFNDEMDIDILTLTPSTPTSMQLEWGLGKSLKGMSE